MGAHQDVRGGAQFPDPSQERGGLVRVGEIGPQEPGAGPGRERLGALRGGAVDADHGRAPGGEQPADGVAELSGGAGDQRGPAGQGRLVRRVPAAVALGAVSPVGVSPVGGGGW